MYQRLPQYIQEVSTHIPEVNDSGVSLDVTKYLDSKKLGFASESLQMLIKELVLLGPETSFWEPKKQYTEKYVTQVIVTKTFIDENAMGILVEFLKPFSNLATLDLSGNEISDKALDILSAALMDNGGDPKNKPKPRFPQLKILDLSKNDKPFIQLSLYNLKYYLNQIQNYYYSNTDLGDGKRPGPVIVGIDITPEAYDINSDLDFDCIIQ